MPPSRRSSAPTRPALRTCRCRPTARSSRASTSRRGRTCGSTPTRSSSGSATSRSCWSRRTASSRVRSRGVTDSDGASAHRRRAVCSIIATGGPSAPSFCATPANMRVTSIIVITALSGFAGLGYEIVWTRLLAVSLGHEIIAVLGVLAALFAGLALGSLIPGRRIAVSARPAAWYAGLELAIGAWAIALIPLFPLVGDLVPMLLAIDASPARQWLVAFALPFVLLLPATLAMGGTLPALEAVLAPHIRAGGAVGRVYAANTFGAAVGTLATTFLIVPAVGISSTLGLCAAINLVCAAAMWLCHGQSHNPAAAPPAASPVAEPSRGRLLPLFVCGLLG